VSVTLAPITVPVVVAAPALKQNQSSRSENIEFLAELARALPASTW
jgi:hypothetical protein